MICPKCEADNLAGKMLCYKCGANLLQAPGEAPQERKKKGGRWKGCLTGCLAVILIVIVASIVIWINRERVAKFLLDRGAVEWVALSVVSEEVNKEEVKEVIAEVREAWERGEFDAEKLEKANRELRKYMADGKLDKEETDKLMEMFREAIGVAEERIAPVEEKLKLAPRERVLTVEEQEEIRRRREEREASSWLQVGDNFVRVRMYDLALEFYQKVIDKHPESQEAQKAREMIEEVRAKLESK